MPGALRNAMLAVLGVLIGSGYTPETFERFGEWSLTLTGIAFYVVIAGGSCFLILRRLGGYDPATAFFSAMPGGLSEMVFIGRANDGDDRTIALIHSTRLLLTVTIIAAWFRASAPDGAALVAVGAGASEVTSRDLALFLASALAGAAAGRALRLPASFLLGPMIVTAAVHLLGWSAARPPVEITAVAQIVIGAAIGCRFAGAHAHELLRAGAAGVAVTSLLMAFTLLATFALGAGTGLPGEVILLAFAPAGIAEMILIALALRLDVAFIAVHHLWRLVLILAAVPLAFRLIRAAAPSHHRDR